MSKLHELIYAMLNALIEYDDELRRVRCGIWSAADAAQDYHGPAAGIFGETDTAFMMRACEPDPKLEIMRRAFERVAAGDVTPFPSQTEPYEVVTDPSLWGAETITDPALFTDDELDELGVTKKDDPALFTERELDDYVSVSPSDFVEILKAAFSPAGLAKRNTFH